MKLSDHRLSKWTLLFGCCAAVFFSLGVHQFAQTGRSQRPARTDRVRDLAGIVDETTRQQLENILENVRQKTGIEFVITTVDSTRGKDIFDFSKELAMQWNVGARSSRKSLLLVLAVQEKTSFTQFSRSVQGELPEGVLGEMSRRIRTHADAGQFGEGLNAGVHYFVNSMAEKLALNAADFEQPLAADSPAKIPKADNSPGEPTAEARPEPSTPVTTSAVPTPVRTSAAREENVSTRPRRTSTSVEDEDESEEVELTLTLPLEARVTTLKAFLDTHPESKSRARAMELLVSAHAGLGDERLKKGDGAGGVEQLMLAITEAPVNASEKLFSGVISQIPLNLYLRGEPAAATKAAQNIEAKFGNDPKRLLALSGFYFSTEQGAEATRIATQAVKLAPELAEAHQALGLALHISLRLDDATAEYKRALELDPKSTGARRSLADLNRAAGKTEEALALYRQQLEAQPNDKPARAGIVLSLLDLGRKDEAKAELERALQTDPKNLSLLAGAAYWFAAHNDSDQALELGSKAIAIEPRYTWSQVAVARALLAQKKPLEAERALRFARQFGKFPTLDYELASALVAAGLFDEAGEVLLQSFVVRDSLIETQLGGHTAARGANFIDLLAPERRASIFQFAAADTEDNAKSLKALLTFATFIKRDNDGKVINEEGAIAAAKEFASGNDDARVHRSLYAASRLLQSGIGFHMAYELAEAARSGADAGLNVAAVTVAVQADEYRQLRARAIAAGGTPDIPEAPRNVLSSILRGRIEDVSGWALVNQDKLDEAVDHLKRATDILPKGTPAWQTALWHLGAALDRQNKKSEALDYYIKSYNAGEPDSIRRTVIEQLYQKVNGSLTGLEERIGAAPTAIAVNTPTPAREETTVHAAQALPSPDATPVTPAPSPQISTTPVVEATPTPSPEAPAVANPTPSPEAPVAPTPSAETAAVATPTPSPEAAAAAVPTPSPEVPAESPTPAPTPLPTANPANAEAKPAPTPTPSAETPAAASPRLDALPGELIPKPPATVKIAGRVKDSSNNPMANVVVVLISPQGTVLASTTDDEGNFSFTVASSTHSYRLIPSKDGFTFGPIDRTLSSVSEDQKQLDFLGTANPKP
jgi:tetratricopeptide (TPR) repeat protein